MTDDVPFDKSFDLEPDKVREIAPQVRAIVANNPGPFTFKGTMSYIIGRGKVAILDPGPNDDAHIGALLDAVRGETVSHILVTHTHRDHSPAVPKIKAATGAKVFAQGPHRLARPLHIGETGRLDASADMDFRPVFGIAGPNGTGKSGIVDAIEFALTGNITRLGGEGTAELSMKAHAPHVDSNTKPEKAVVKVAAYAPTLGKVITIERNVKVASTPTITPNDAKTREFVAKLETHPEFALSRREIIKYILTPPGKRSTDVQTLLRLEQVEKVRTSLLRVANDAKK